MLLLSLCNLAQAQSLVSNGYFEIYDTCPNFPSQMNRAVSWKIASLTPDYYNNCSSANDGINVPYATLGYQQDCCGGEGYAGEYMFYNDSTNSGREYIYTKLKNTLTAGHIYIANMYASRANYVDYAITSPGILFTDTLTVLPQGQSFIPANPQVKSNILLADTVNWILVQDTFVANGNEVYLTIGNFNTNATSDTVFIGNPRYPFSIAYYYIDGVSVYDITGVACNTYWDAGYDKYIIAGDSIRLGAINTDNSIYSWQNSVGGNTYLSSNTDARPWCKPAKTTTYYATKTCPNNNVFKDTVTVYVQQTTGIEQYANNVKIKLYPNPSNGNISIEYYLHTDAVIEITDITGNLVGSYYMSATETTIQVQNNYLQSGVYLYKVISNDNIIKLGKIIVMQ